MLDKHKIAMGVSIGGVLLGSVTFGSFIWSNFVQAKPQEQFFEEKIYSLEGVKELKLDFSHTRIEVTHRSDEQMKITLEQKLKKGDPQRCLYELREERDGSQLKITTAYQQIAVHRQCSISRALSIQIGEAQFQTFLMKHHHGDLNLAAINYSTIAINKKHGDIEAQGFRASSFTLTQQHSKTTIGNLNADNIDIQGGHGNLNINSFKSTEGGIDWEHGLIKMHKSESDVLKAKNSHGKIVFENHKGKRLKLINSHGGTELMADIDELKIQSSHGKINVTSNIASTAKVENKHGPVKFSGHAGQMKIKNSHGSISIIQKEDKPFNITASVSHGNLNFKAPESTQYDYFVQGSASIDGKRIPRKQANEGIAKDEGLSSKVNFRSTHGHISIEGYENGGWF